MASAPQLKADYPLGRLSAFTSPHYPGLPWEAIAHDRAAYPVNRALLQQVLHRQYGPYGHLPPALAENLAALALSTTFCITTGQQPALAGGPLYTLLKAISAIQLAQQAQQRLGPAHRVAPLFWMASEDHDAPEVNHAWLGWGQRVQYEGAFRGAVGRHVITERVKGLLPQGSAAAAVFMPGQTWAEAFKAWLHALLGHHGLLVLDPDDAQLKQAFLPMALQELTHQKAEGRVAAATQRLGALGYSAQLHARPINLFYLTNNARTRLEPTPIGYQLADAPHTAWAATDLLDEASQHPQRLSPNAVLRPLYQETVVPSLAYVGGWAEVAYWLQLKDVFQAAGVFLPPVVPRSQALLVTGPQARQWLDMGLSPAQWQLPRHELMRLLVARHWQDHDLQDALTGVQAAWHRLGEVVAPLDAGQHTQVQAAWQRHQHWAQRLQAKLVRQLARHNPAWVQPALALQHAVQPPGMVQERTLAAAAFGPHEAHLAQWLLQHLQPLTPGVQVLGYTPPDA